MLEYGQGHTALGTNSWQDQGATVIALADAVHEIEQHAFRLPARMKAGSRERSMSTKVALPEQTFRENKRASKWAMSVSNCSISRPTHSPGDIVVWLPRKPVICCDMAFHERMLPVFKHTDSAARIETRDRFAALGAELVIPGHGGPTKMVGNQIHPRLPGVRARRIGPDRRGRRGLAAGLRNRPVALLATGHLRCPGPASCRAHLPRDGIRNAGPAKPAGRTNSAGHSQDSPKKPPEPGASVAAVYELADGEITPVKGAGGPSPTDASERVRALEVEYAKGWFKNITADMFT